MFCLDSCPNEAYVFAIGGEKTFRVWDVREVKDGKYIGNCIFTIKAMYILSRNIDSYVRIEHWILLLFTFYNKEVPTLIKSSTFVYLVLHYPLVFIS